MNNQQLYLAWLRTTSPTLYAQAVRMATGRSRNLGGLADDLLQQALSPNLMHSFLGDDTTLDTITVSSDAPAPVTTDMVFAPGNFSFDPSTVDAPSFSVPIDSGAAVGFPSAAAPAAQPVAAPSSTFANILQAVTTIGAGVIQASNQSKLIDLNTARARAGQPPVDATGRVVSPYAVSPTNSAIARFEKSITGGMSGSMLPILAMLGIGAFVLLRKKSA